MTHLATDHIKDFVTAGRARFTLLNTQTGNRFTYRVSTNRDASTYFVHLLSGPDNESDYRYLGFIKHGNYIHGGRKTNIGISAQGAQVFAWFWRNLGKLPAQVEVHHEGRCGRCGRALTVPESISIGLGPECAGKVAA
jgi:hypothetical protein